MRENMTTWTAAESFDLDRQRASSGRVRLRVLLLSPTPPPLVDDYPRNSAVTVKSGSALHGRGVVASFNSSNSHAEPVGGSAPHGRTPTLA
jgi:hypothetical protein